MSSQWRGLLRLALLGLGLLVACAQVPMNQPLRRPLTQQEVFRERPRAPLNSDEIVLVLSFSGGGTRAAALAYGVLESLAATSVPGGPPRRLLDEVELITSVSGGSFTAAYYGLYGDRVFTDFEPRFLRGHVGRHLLLRFLSPITWYAGGDRCARLPASATRSMR